MSSIKIGPTGKERLRQQVKFHLDQEKSGVPRQALEYMIAEWVKGLLENSDSPELRKQLEE